MVKVAWSAGHGGFGSTPGKRSPDGEFEWNFNNIVVEAAMAQMAKYENVQQLRVDDASGRADISLIKRTNAANQWGADVYISCHHNAMSGEWGSHGGIETFTFDHPEANKESVTIASAIHPRVVKVMRLSDRGLKKANFHELRETKMPAVLVEGGFMDSRVDIKRMRDNKVLQAQGRAIADGVAQHFGLTLKGASNPVVTIASDVKIKEEKYLKPSTNVLENEVVMTLELAHKKGILTSDKWVNLAKEGKLTVDDAVALQMSITRRTLLSK